MSLTLRTVQLDVPADDHPAAVAFWAAALHARPVATDGGRYVHLPDASAVVEVHVQRLDDGPARIHLDLAAGTPATPGDQDAEVARLVAAGAEVVGHAEEGWTVLRTPAGLPVCIVPGAAAADPLAPGRPGASRLDAVFVDVPADDVPQEVAFWSAALDAEVARPAEPSSPYTYLTGVGGREGPLYCAVQAVDAPARHHVDLTAPDVDAEVARLEALGATVVARIEGWVTLADPAGILCCVVPADDDLGDTTGPTDLDESAIT
jgi:predicted enzyme related to lactoylglutathione lyase